MAQSVERVLGKDKVAGSIPARGLLLFLYPLINRNIYIFLQTSDFMEETVLKGECTDLCDVLAVISQNGNYTSPHCLSLYHENHDVPHTKIYLDNKIITKFETYRIKEIYGELEQLQQIELLESLIDGSRDSRIEEMKKRVLKGLGTKESSLVYLLYDSITNKGDYFTFGNGFDRSLNGKNTIRIDLNEPFNEKLIIAIINLVNPLPATLEKQDSSTNTTNLLN